jgi:hypothetical protein
MGPKKEEKNRRDAGILSRKFWAINLSIETHTTKIKWKASIDDMHCYINPQTD